MFNQEFYPTPAHVIELMCEGLKIEGKTILEPSAGKGDIVKYLTNFGADVIACETNKDLQEILKSKCTLIEDDFFKLTSDKVSHINAIVMNPPFSNADKHILHAYSIAPAGCKIIALCNIETVKNTGYSSRRELQTVISEYGQWQDIGNCFEESERQTSVNVALVTINKAGSNESAEFEGFFTDEEPEQEQYNGLMPYDFVRDLVNRYIGAVKIYSELLTVKSRLNSMTGSFFGGDIGIQTTLSYNSYKKELQKSGWKFIFDKMNMQKYATRGLREDINKFVEQQTHIPFTMKNIYRMLEIVIGTQSQRMDKALLEVFERVTQHHADNRYNVKGWKTNSHFLVGKKFILPYMINPSKEYGYTSEYYSSLKSSYDGTIPDLEKALCFVTGEPYETTTIVNGREVKEYINTVNASINRNIYGEWYESHFFKYKGYKNGNMHFEFKNEDVWAMFNQHIARIKGYPLFEAKKQTAYQDRQTGRAYQKKAPMQAPVSKAEVLFEINI